MILPQGKQIVNSFFAMFFVFIFPLCFLGCRFRLLRMARGLGERTAPRQRGCVGSLYLRRAISWRLGPVDTMVMGTPTRFSKNST